MDALGVKVMRLSTICTFGGVGAIGAGAHLFTSGEAAAAGVLAALGVALLGLVAWAYGVRPPERLRSGSRRAAAPAFAGLLVLSVVASGPAVGALGFQDCSLDDSLVSAFVSSFLSPTSQDTCRFNPDDGSLTSHTDYYQQGLQMNASAQTFIVSQRNYALDRRPAVWTDAKVEIVSEMNNGSTATATKGAANETIEDAYSTFLVNVLNNYQVRVEAAEYAWNNNESYVETAKGDSLVGFATYNYTLPNGTKYPYRTYIRGVSTNQNIVLPAGGSYGVPYSNGNLTDLNAPTISNDSTQIDGVGVAYDDGDASDVDALRYTDPTSANTTDAVPTADYGWLVRDMQVNQAPGLKSNVGAYVDGVYSSYTAGELNVTDILNPTDLASRAATDYNSTGYYSFASLQLASIGYGGDLNASFEVDYKNETRYGDLFYTADDLDNFAAGTTYNTADLNGSVVAVFQGENGTANLTTLDGEFTVSNITNPTTGESLNTTSIQTYTYEGTDVSALSEELDRLQELREEYENTSAPSGGGGWNLDLGGTQTGALIALAAVVALFALKD